MDEKLLQIFPPDGVKIITTLFLCFLIGLEREEHRASFQDNRRYSFGGVRAFPLIGLIGYAMALISGPQLLPLTVGFAVIGAFHSIVLDGIVERFPKLRWGFIEVSAQWIPYVLNDLELRFKRRRSEERRVGKECRFRWSSYH